MIDKNTKVALDTLPVNSSTKTKLQQRIFIIRRISIFDSSIGFEGTIFFFIPEKYCFPFSCHEFPIFL
ncbi:MAG: hypothetical protein CML14_00460 [Puniceicoccaceae bacterium]|nr:hypothetical protein [Puniceicoccaceae bacterium]